MASKRRISLIAAVSENGVIGRDNQLPWRLSDDFRHFKRTTTGHCLIMGRKTFESIGLKALKGRRNVIVTTRDSLDAEGEIVLAGSLEEAIDRCGECDEIFIGGGEGIFNESVPVADRLVLTRVHANVEGDTRFPEIDFSEWTLVSSERHEQDERNDYAFTIEVWEARNQESGSRIQDPGFRNQE